MPMGSIPVVSAWRLTGRSRARQGWFGRMIVQVEEQRRHGGTQGPRIVYGTTLSSRWRDARFADFEAGVVRNESELLPTAGGGPIGPNHLAVSS